MLSFPTANENSLSLSLHKESRFTHQYKIEGDKIQIILIITHNEKLKATKRELFQQKTLI